MLKSVVAALAAASLMAAGASAADAPLTEDQAKRFVASLDAVEMLADEFEAEGKMEELQIDTQPKPDQAFTPYSGAVEALNKRYPAGYTRLKDTVAKHGFKAKDWGGVGDQVIAAYLAIKMEEENPGMMAQMKAMDPAMLEMLPPQAKAQFQQSLTMMETIENTPPENKKAVASVRKELDQHMNE